MRQIYRRATRVNIWLGVPFPGVEDLFNRLATFAGSENVSELLDGPVVGQSASETVRNITRIFEYEWWSRVWVLQESVVAKKANVFCGACFLDFGDLMRAYTLLLDDIGKGSDSKMHPAGYSETELLSAALLRFPRAFANLRMLLHKPNKPETAWILTLAAWSKATGPRDKIFAIQGLLSEPLPLPDYSKPWTEVYADCAFEVLRQSRSFALLTQVGGPFGDAASVPSWAVDWRYPTGAMEHITMYPHYRSIDPQDFTLTRLDRGTLRMSIKILDGIERVGAAYDRPVVHEFHKGIADALFNTISDWARMCGVPEETSFELLVHATAHVNAASTPRREGTSTKSAASDTQNRTLSAASDTFWRTVCLDVIEDEMSGRLRRAIRTDAVRVCKVIQWIVAGVTFEHRHDISWYIDRRLAGLRMFKTSDAGWIGLGKERIMAGDLVVLVAGAAVPFIMRPCGSNYELLSHCFVHGLMDGEGLDKLSTFADVCIV